MMNYAATGVQPTYYMPQAYAGYPQQPQYSPYYNPYNYYGYAQQPQPVAPKPAPVQQQPVQQPQQLPKKVFYAFELDALKPPKPAKGTGIGLMNWMVFPFHSWSIYRNLSANPQTNEPYKMRVAMYRELYSALGWSGHAHLKKLLKEGKLTDTNSDTKRSTLAHLYAIMKMPRAAGLKNRAILEETLRVMAEPQTITQKFGRLSQPMINNLLKFYKGGYGPKITDPIDANMLKVVSSATCVSSSLMYYMAERNPSEFARHISELTSPSLAFYEKAYNYEVSPDDPTQADDVLDSYGVKYSEVKPGEYWVKVDLPYSGLIRVANDQNHRTNERGPVESAYQAALTHLAVSTYDPGLDMRVNPDGTLDTNKGLEEDRKTLMETIIKDNGGVMSVTYQFTASDRNGDAYLMGYYRSFDQTAKDITSAVDKGEYPIIGITDTSSPSGWYAGKPGKIIMGHELTVVGYHHDYKGNLIFKIADSDDDKPKLVERKASEIIPKIHHAGFPVKQAKQIWSQVNGQLNNQYMIPDKSDSAKFQLIATVPSEQQPALLKEYQDMMAEEEAQNQQQQPAPAPQPQPAQQPAYQKPYAMPAYQQAMAAPQQQGGYQRPVYPQQMQVMPRAQFPQQPAYPQQPNWYQAQQQSYQPGAYNWARSA